MVYLLIKSVFVATSNMQPHVVRGHYFVIPNWSVLRRHLPSNVISTLSNDQSLNSGLTVYSVFIFVYFFLFVCFSVCLCVFLNRYTFLFRTGKNIENSYLQLSFHILIIISVTCSFSKIRLNIQNLNAILHYQDTTISFWSFTTIFRHVTDRLASVQLDLVSFWHCFCCVCECASLSLLQKKRTSVIAEYVWPPDRVW